MKHFAYYETERGQDRSGNSKNTVTVIHIQNNRPRVLATVERGYRNASQAAIETAIEHGKLGAAHRGKTPARLFNEDMAEFTQL